MKAVGLIGIFSIGRENDMKKFKGSMDELLKLINIEKLDVVLFGAASTAAEAVQEPGLLERIRYIVDNDPNKQGRMFQNRGIWIPIYSPSVLNQVNPDHTVLLITSVYYREITLQLESEYKNNSIMFAAYHVVKYGSKPGSEEYFQRRYLSDCLNEYKNALHRRGEDDAALQDTLIEKEQEYLYGNSPTDRPIVIPRMQIITHNLCNLKCTNCCARIPTITDKHISPVEQCIRDLRMVLDSVDQCINLNICPEPFIYPELRELLIYVQQQDKIVSAELFTNCVSPPKEEVLDILADPKFFVNCSDYGRIKQMGATVEVLEKAKVRFGVFSDLYWFDPGDIKARGRTKEELREHCMICPINYQKSIYNGAFYSCAVPSRLLAQECDYRSENDFFLLRDNETTESRTKKLRQMLLQDSWDACDYCDWGHLPHKTVPAGEQMNGEARSKYTIVCREELEALRYKEADKVNSCFYYPSTNSNHPIFLSERLKDPDSTLVLWGTGECFSRNLKAVEAVQKVTCVTCNSPEKWGKELAPGIQCVSPDEIKGLSKVMVVIMVEDTGACFQIANQLLDMGITRFEHIYNWLYYKRRDAEIK